jgi:branched-chain amino acid transport system permease protein
MTTTVDTPTAAPAGWAVRRSDLTSRIGSLALLALALVLAGLPQVFGAAIVQQATSLLILVILAAMWNALAGYAGLVSVGQQTFIGFGAYGTIFLTQRDVPPYLAVVVAAVGAAVLAAVLSPLVLRLRGGQFAVGTWVVAETLALLVLLDHALGGGTGISLRGLNVYPPQVRRAYTFWLTSPSPSSCSARCSSCCAAAPAPRCRRSATTRRPPPPSACARCHSSSASSSSPDSAAARPAP